MDPVNGLSLSPDRLSKVILLLQGFSTAVSFSFRLCFKESSWGNKNISSYEKINQSQGFIQDFPFGGDPTFPIPLCETLKVMLGIKGKHPPPIVSTLEVLRLATSPFIEREVEKGLVNTAAFTGIGFNME